jgi:hypothetical protein
MKKKNQKVNNPSSKDPTSYQVTPMHAGQIVFLIEKQMAGWRQLPKMVLKKL